MAKYSLESLAGVIKSAGWGLGAADRHWLRWTAELRSSTSEETPLGNGELAGRLDKEKASEKVGDRHLPG